MHRTIIWITWLFAYLFTLIPLYFKCKRLAKEGKEEERLAIVDREVEKWTSKLLRHIGISLEVIGKENLPGPGETVLFVANHQSYLDIPIVLLGFGRPYPLLAKKELKKVPLLHNWMDQIGCLYVDRDDMRSSLDTLKAGEQLLKSGRSLTVFPEGTRSKSDTMGEFKGGAMRMALKAKTPIVPVAIDGSYKGFEGNRHRLQKADVRLIILPSISTENLTKEEQKALPEQLHAMIEQAKNNR